jgi:hypothetical protein
VLAPGAFAIPAPRVRAAPLPPNIRIYPGHIQSFHDDFDHDFDFDFDFDIDARSLIELEARMRDLGVEAGARARQAAERVRDALRGLRVEMDFDDRDRRAADETPRARTREREALERENEELSRQLRELQRRQAPAVTRITSGAAPTAVAAGTPLWTGDGVVSATATGERFTLSLPGLTLAPVNRDLASYFGAGSERGLLVTEVDDRWPGLREGDVLLRVDGRPVSDGRRATLSISVDEEHRLEVLRQARRQTIALTPMLR